MDVDVRTRQDLLRFASRITPQPADAVAVVANTIPMVEWLEDAPNDWDFQARLAALDRQHSNLLISGQRPDQQDSEDADPAANSADAYVQAAAVLHRFTTA